MQATTPDYEVLIVGAGFGGIGAAVELRKAGIHNFVMVDKWHAVGGTWLANTYPGVAVDIPSVIYSFSFAQRSNWSRLFPEGAELQQYAEDVVDEFGLRSKLRLNTKLVATEFDEEQDLWRARTESGDEITARFVIAAVGGLEQPKLPEIEGVESFARKVIHTAMWDHDYDLAGKRVAVIGTGASSLQLVPVIADTVEHLTVYQRTPIWVAPKIDFEAGILTRAVLGRRVIRETVRGIGGAVVSGAIGGLFVFDRVAPVVGGAAGSALKLWMRTQVPDRELRDKLTPDYMLGCKRPSMSNTYLKTFTRPDVDLVTEPIERITETGIVTQDGAEREVDVLVCATGFKVIEQGSTPPYPVRGRDGLDLGEFWHENRYQAYHGVSVPKFPNAFLILGPYGYAPSSYLELIEATSAHAVRAIVETRRRGATSCEVRQEPHDRYFRWARERTHRTHLFTDACATSNTYYVNYQGDSWVRPSTAFGMQWGNRHFPLDDYAYTSLPAAGTSAAADHRKQVA
jgi:cation diffusion facilitator CzcD-associated flavoprotein CzcO